VSSVKKMSDSEEKFRRLVQDNDERYRLLADNVNDIIWMMDISQDGLTYSYISPSITKIRGYSPKEAMKLTLPEVLTPESLRKVELVFGEEYNNDHERDPNRCVILELEEYCKDGGTVWTELTTSFIRDDQKRPVAILGVSRNITARKSVEEKLELTLRKLEDRVKERTARLEIQKTNLEETNTALEILLKKREADKAEIEENVLLNVKELLEPLLEKLKTSGLNDKQMTLVNVLETNLMDIISSFSQKLSLSLCHLSPVELQVANFIKHGKSTKEIASFLQLSPKTIKNHRGNIRKKLNLNKKRINLRSYLLSLD